MPQSGSVEETQMRTLIPCAFALLAAGLGGGLVVGTSPAVPGPAAGNPSAPAGQPAKPDTIKELQEKRIAVLKEIVQLAEQAYKGSQFGLDQVIKARLDLLQAQLDTSQTREDRVRLLEEMVKQAEALEEAVKKLVEAKRATGIEGLKAKAFVLETKITLERARAAKGP